MIYLLTIRVTHLPPPETQVKGQKCICPRKNLFSPVFLHPQILQFSPDGMMSVFKSATWNKSSSGRDELNGPAEPALTDPVGLWWGPVGVIMFHCEEINRYKPQLHSKDSCFLPQHADSASPWTPPSTCFVHGYHRLLSQHGEGLQMCRLMSVFSYELREHRVVPGWVQHYWCKTRWASP